MESLFLKGVWRGKIIFNPKIYLGTIQRILRDLRK